MTEPAAEAFSEAQALAASAPTPALVNNIAFGTAGWTDPSLIRSGRFYGKQARSAAERLAFYATHFPFVEVDASYYTVLAPTMAQRWLLTTPETFRFHIKAYAALTGHPLDWARLPAELKVQVGAHAEGKKHVYPRQLPAALLEQIYAAFEAFIAPLKAQGRLSSILLQFPPWFDATRGNSRQIEEVAERFADYPLSVEFRNASWLDVERRERVLTWLEEKKLGYVIVDEPSGVEYGGVPSVLSVPRSELAVFRFHGQNRAGWRRGASVAERFNYLYSPSELSSWVAKLEQVAKQAKQVDVVFNNCIQDYAILNAKGLSRLLQRALLEANRRTDAEPARED